MWLAYLFVFTIGAVIGSFLNVVIARVPASQSIVRPASRCPKCGAGIKPYDNVPILSYALLRGRCRNCSQIISPRYPVVEALTGALLTIVFLKFGFTFQAYVYSAFAAALVAVTFIDLDHQIIPDVISLPGGMIALLIPVALVLAGKPQLWPLSIADALLGLIVGACPLLLFGLIYYYLTKVEGLGLGDVKLLAWVGALLGWKLVLMTIMVGSIIGSFISIPVLFLSEKGRKTAIPFGPFLSAGALISLLGGETLIQWWMSLGMLLNP